MARRELARRGERISSAHWTHLDRLLVPTSKEGALELGDLYLRELRRLTGTLVRTQVHAGRVFLTLAGLVDLITLDRAVATTGHSDVECRYPIVGGVLVACPGGSLSLVQRGGARPELGLVVENYAPRLATGREWVRRLLYDNVQARLHAAIGNRFLTRMRERAR